MTGQMEGRSKRGRPIKPGGAVEKKSGGAQSVAMCVRVSKAMRESIEAEAKLHGKSLGWVAERWLEDGRFLAGIKARLEAERAAPLPAEPREAA
jgi:hypothetical protein